MYPQSTKTTRSNHRGKGGQYGLLGSRIDSIRILLKTTLLITLSFTNQFQLKPKISKTLYLSEQCMIGINWMIV